MDTISLRNEYYKLNTSFKKKFIFHLGSDAGFFSEYNNMILAMLYCLTNKIQFILYSEDANFSYQKGWTDYFCPFCDEVFDDFHKKYNFRDYEFIQQKLGKIDKLKIKSYKFINGIDFLTQDLWLLIRSRDHETEIYNIPELDIINSSLREACKILISITWHYNDDAKALVKSKIDLLKLPSEYLGFHIRRGDKYIEQKTSETYLYFEKIKNLSLRNIFISTDDYNTILEIKNGQYLQYNFFSLCREDQTGYDQNQYKILNKNQLKENQIDLFTSIDILSNSQFFVGTFSSNIGMFLGMKMDAKKSVSVDIDWRIW
ncbi:MAG: hypothetical protein LBN74_05235 [Prevotella sp.]|jgi:hypothetical protein|nr:hypothetical protein [Prevotella sp.]